MKSYDLSAFDKVPSARELVKQSFDVGELPSIEDVRTLAAWDAEMRDSFGMDASAFNVQPNGSKRDRSGAMMQFAYMAAEHRWSDEQIMAALYDLDERWGKYVHRKDRDRRLLDFLNRAREKIGYDPVDNTDLSSMLLGKTRVVDATSDKEQLIYGAIEFVDMEFKIDWMLEGLLSTGGLGFVTGYPGTGKTQFCLQLGISLALGHNEFFKWPNLSSAKKVMFMSLEMAKAPLNMFLTKITGAYTDKRTLDRNLKIAPFGESLPLDDDRAKAFIGDLLSEHMPDVLIIDSFQKSMSKEMTDEQAVKQVMSYLAEIRQKYNCAVVIIHHNRKKANEAAKKEVELSDIYGSYLIGAEADFVISLKRSGGNVVAVDMLKNRLGPMVDSFDIIRDDHLQFHYEDREMMGAVQMGFADGGGPSE